MIENLDIQNNVYAMLFKMHHAQDITFYLTGSRFFGGWNNLSDYDFFVEFSHNAEVWLKENGFSKISTSYTYGTLDKGCMFVYQHYQFPIHIQVTVSAKQRLRVRNAAISIPWCDIPKAKRYLYWNALYRAAE